jgi:hypothetical protein
VSDPKFVTTDQMRAAYDALGLDGDGFNRTRSVEFQPHEVRVTRYVVNDEGQLSLDEFDKPYDETVTIPLSALEHDLWPGPAAT